MKKIAALGLCLLGMATGAQAVAATAPAHALRGDAFRYRAEIISLNRGLAQHDVSSVAQDRYGFIWIATYNGLHRYDGYGFRIFRHRYNEPGSIGDNRILYIHRDARSRLLVATEGGGVSLYDYDDDNFTNFRFGENPPDNNIYHICEERGTLWIGSSSGLYRAVFDSLDRFYWERYASTPDIRAVGTIAPGRIVMGTLKGAYVLYHAEGPGGYTRIAGIGDEMVGTVQEYGTDGLLLGTESGLYLWRGRGPAMKIDFPGLEAGVGAITPLDGGQLLVATLGNGIFVMGRDPNRGYTFRKMGIENAAALEPSVIKSLFIDSMRNLWIGTGTSGVFRVNLHANRFYRFFSSPNEGGSFVRAFLKDSQGRMWLQTRHARFCVMEGERTTEIDLHAPGDPVPVVVGILENSDGSIWFCTSHKLYRLPPGGDVRRPQDMTADLHRTPMGASMSLMHSIACDDQGTVWVGCWNGLLKVGAGENRTYRYAFYGDFSFQNQDMGVTDIFCDRAGGKLWICSRNYGLMMADLDAEGDISDYTLFSHLGEEGHRLSSNHVWSVVRTSDGVVWVGTDAGLNSIEFVGGKPLVRQIETPERLHNDKILSIRQDDGGDLWLGTSDGLLRYSPADARLMQYYARDGLSSSGLTEGMMRDTDGVIWVSTINGVTAFRPEEIHPNEYLPLVHITGLKIFNREVSVGEKVNGRVILPRSLLETPAISLRYNQNNFSIGFVAVHFSNPARNSYMYKLEGYDKEWIEGTGGDLSASYNNLPVGRYTFRVKAANSDGGWNAQDASLDVSIGRAPWFAWWAWVLYALLLGSATWAVVRYYHRQRTFRNNLYIEQLNYLHERQLTEAREKFQTNITHELRTPLTLITSPLEDLAGCLSDDPWVRTRLELISNNTRRLLQLVNQFLDLRRLDAADMALRVSRIEIDAVARRIVDNFRMYARQKDINLALVSEFSPITGLFDEEKVTKILFNLISNAMKFTPAGGTISVILSPQEDTLMIDIEDTGCGIAPDDLPRIFARFYQAEIASSSGTGIGLSLVQKLVELHHGTVSVASRPGEGARFTVALPLGEGGYSHEQIVASELRGSAASGPANVSETALADGGSGEKPIVLVVEDDPDMRTYLAECLGDNFDVLSEENATAGREAALRFIPDLIITDVMMPGQSGLELCGQLKADFRTSHIPIIILTARADQQDVVAGLRTGAENYLTKPFNSEQLLLKVGNIIAYSNRPDKNPPAGGNEPEPLNEREQKFLDKLSGIVESNMADSDYSVEDLCRDLGVSRMQLHRKLTVLLGKTTSEFIRDAKMARARELIRSGNYNVSETIYQVGFKSNSHFSKTFKAAFGLTPSEFARQAKG